MRVRVPRSLAAAGAMGMWAILAAWGVLGCRQVSSKASTSSGNVIDSLPDDPLGRAIRLGRALVIHPHDSLPAFAPSNLNCTSCHLEEGGRTSAVPLTAAFARYPRYMDRTGGIASLEDRVNYCFTRSLAGTALPMDSREMKAIVAYLAFLSRGLVLGRAPSS